MSHTSTYKETITDIPQFLEIVGKHGDITIFTTEEMVHQFGRNAVKAIAKIELPGWKYPIALTKDGELKYDHWGSTAKSFDLLKDCIVEYNVEMVKKNIPMEAENWTMETDLKTEDIVIEVFF